MSSFRGSELSLKEVEVGSRRSSRWKNSQSLPEKCSSNFYINETAHYLHEKSSSKQAIALCLHDQRSSGCVIHLNAGRNLQPVPNVLSHFSFKRTCCRRLNDNLIILLTQPQDHTTKDQKIRIPKQKILLPNSFQSFEVGER